MANEIKPDLSLRERAQVWLKEHSEEFILRVDGAQMATHEVLDEPAMLAAFAAYLTPAPPPTGVREAPDKLRARHMFQEDAWIEQKAAEEDGADVRAGVSAHPLRDRLSEEKIMKYAEELKIRTWNRGDDGFGGEWEINSRARRAIEEIYTDGQKSGEKRPTLLPPHPAPESDLKKAIEYHCEDLPDALNDLLDNKNCSCGGWTCPRCVLAFDTGVQMLRGTKYERPSQETPK